MGTSSRRAVIFTVPTNGMRWLNANDRWKSIHAKSRLVKEWRFMAGIYARSNGVPRYEQCKVVVIVHRAFSGTADVLNWSDTVKPVIDGFTDAKCWPNDDNDHVVVDIRAGEEWPKPGLEVLIIPVGVDREWHGRHDPEALRQLREKKLARRKRRAIL